MPKYIPKLLQRFKHEPSKRPQHSPYKAPPKTYGAAAQDPLPEDDTDKLNEPRVKEIQGIIGGILYYARAVDHTGLAYLSLVAGDQEEASERTEAQAQQLMEYFATHPQATIQYYASEMILNIHSVA